MKFAAECRQNDFAGCPPAEFKSDYFFSVVLKRVLEEEELAGQVTGQVETWILNVIREFAEPKSSSEIQQIVGIKHRETFQRNYLDKLLEEKFVERTIPDKPNSRLQKYRMTEKGRALLESEI